MLSGKDLCACVINGIKSDYEKDFGAVAVGYRADMLVLDDLVSFKPKYVIKNGKVLSKLPLPIAGLMSNRNFDHVKKIVLIYPKTHENTLKYWDYNKNKLLTPEIVSHNSRNKVWWKCPDCDYGWEATIKSQVKKQIMCPHCRKGIKDLASMAPDIVKEWDHDKNIVLDPRHITYACNKYAWWKCSKCGYEYQANICHRTNKKNPTGCPMCGKERSALTKSISINMIDIKTNQIVKTFTSISEAGKQMKTNPANIGCVCRGQRSKAGGYKWEYADENISKKYKKQNNQLELNLNN